jgi:hypothetical protein
VCAVEKIFFDQQYEDSLKERFKVFEIYQQLKKKNEKE